MYGNGRLPNSALSPIPGGRLRKGPAVRSWLAMRFYIGRKEGVWIRPTGPASSYRALYWQQRFYQAYLSGRGPLAAKPGTSNHGLGLAVDLPTEQMQAAVREHGYKFGWGILGGKMGYYADTPTEPWHALYRGPYTRLARRWYWRYRMARALRRGRHR